MQIAIAAKKGKFQVQRIVYDAKGKATVFSQSGWLPTLEVAQCGKRYLEQYDAAQTDYDASGDESDHDRMLVARNDFRELIDSYKEA